MPSARMDMQKEKAGIMVDWYQLDAQEAVRQINSHYQNGLTAEEAARRLAEYGPE